MQYGFYAMLLFDNSPDYKLGPERVTYETVSRYTIKEDRIAWVKWEDDGSLMVHIFNHDGLLEVHNGTLDPGESVFYSAHSSKAVPYDFSLLPTYDPISFAVIE